MDCYKAFPLVASRMRLRKSQDGHKQMQSARASGLSEAAANETDGESQQLGLYLSCWMEKREVVSDPDEGC